MGNSEMMDALETKAISLADIKQTQEEVGSHAELITRAHAVAVKDQASYDNAGKLGLELRRRQKVIETKFDPLCKTTDAAHVAATTARKESMGPLKNIIRIVADKMNDWKREQAVKKVAAERRERERLEAIERAKREKEIEEQRILAEAAAKQRRKEAEAAAAAAANKREAARIVSEAEKFRLNQEAQAEADAAMKREAPIFTPAVEERHAVKRYETEKVAGITHRVNWDFDVVDIGKAPLTWLILDEKRVRRLVKATGKDAEKILGGAIRVFDKGSTSFRTK